jgi:hypothetical protein
MNKRAQSNSCEDSKQSAASIEVTYICMHVYCMGPGTHKLNRTHVKYLCAIWLVYGTLNDAREHEACDKPGWQVMEKSGLPIRVDLFV